MTDLRPSEVHLDPLPLDAWQRLLSEERWAKLADVVGRGTAHLEGRTLWCVNSTAKGGGVAEMLRTLLSYARGAGLDTRWAVIAGEPEFFRVTKRLHNLVHGSPGDGGGLGDHEREVYDHVTQANLGGLLERIEPGDPVILHDPQTAGLVEPLREHGAVVVWRSHIGAEAPNEHVRTAWSFIAPYVEHADALVFSRHPYVPPELEDGRTWVIPPSIDPFAPKNQDLDDEVAHAILAGARLVQGEPDAPAEFRRLDGTTAPVVHHAELLDGGEAPAADRPLVVQVSRWDRLKDHLGVLRGFAGRTLDQADADLVLAGPDARSVADDPEGQEALQEILDAVSKLPEDRRARVHVASLPMDDLDENAAIVNALQHHAHVVVQKSLEEGFGLTVTEAMWKARPMVASKVGGIREQVEDGRTGVTLDDPSDLDAFGDAVAGLLNDRERADRLGQAGRQNVLDHFLHDRHFAQYVDLLDDLRDGRG
jgi:trehalose synthase